MTGRLAVRHVVVDPLRGDDLARGETVLNPFDHRGEDVVRRVIGRRGVQRSLARITERCGTGTALGREQNTCRMGILYQVREGDGYSLSSGRRWV
jgi:hypothetical protein